MRRAEGSDCEMQLHTQKVPLTRSAPTKKLLTSTRLLGLKTTVQNYCREILPAETWKSEAVVKAMSVDLAANVADSEDCHGEDPELMCGEWGSWRGSCVRSPSPNYAIHKGSSTLKRRACRLPPWVSAAVSPHVSRAEYLE